MPAYIVPTLFGMKARNQRSLKKQRDMDKRQTAYHEAGILL